MASLAAAAVNSEHEEILLGLDGKKLQTSVLEGALQKMAGGPADEHKVVDFNVMPGSVKKWPQSQSAVLEVDVEEAMKNGVPILQRYCIFLKKIFPAARGNRPVQNVRRELASNRNEARFYEEFAPTLISRGVPLLRALHVDDRLNLSVSEETDEATQLQALYSGGLLLLLQCAPPTYFQDAPFDAKNLKHSMELLAVLHASAWEDASFLQRVSERLHPVAGYWTLGVGCKADPADLQKMEDHWQLYLKGFTPLNSELLTRPEIQKLSSRIAEVATSVACELQPGPEGPFATIVHGDYKAMNVFLLEDEQLEGGRDGTCNNEDSPKAILIDFQWIGVGLGMSDVAMHLYHSAATEALDEIGEETLVDWYYDALQAELSRRLGGSSSTFRTYTRELAHRHYRLASVDYARGVLLHFFKNASPEAFEGHREIKNVGLFYRNIENSFRFVERVDRCLKSLGM